MAIILRPYQLAAIRYIHAELARHRSTILVLPTGCGKTVVFCDVIQRYVQDGQRVLVLAHRKELIEQAAAKLGQVGLIHVAIEKGRHRSNGEPVVVASVQTLRGERLEAMPRDAFGLIVVDECHRTMAKGHRAILDHFEAAKVLGVTATPDRLDGKALGQVFDSVAYQYSIQDAIRAGYLAPIRSRRVHVQGLDLARIRTRAGDLHAAELAEALMVEQTLHRVAAPLVELAGDRPTVVFAVDVAHAEAMAEVINRYRPDSARWLSGKTSDRTRCQTLDAYHAGEFQFLVNCALLTEGWDAPAVSCVAIARPTKSRALYAQMVGRGTRLHPGKADLLVLDFVGNTGKHRLISTADVLAGRVVEDEDVAQAAEFLAGADDDIDDLDALDMAETFLFAEKRQAKVLAVARFVAEEIDPFLPPPPDARVWTHDSPTNGQLTFGAWVNNPASDKQLAVLHKHGLKPPPNLTAGQASEVISRIIARDQSGLSTFKQIRFLRRHHYDEPERLTKSEARKAISRVIAGHRGRARRTAR